MGTVYNQEEKGDQPRLGFFIIWCSGLSISFRLLFQLFSSCICSNQQKTNDRRVRKVSSTVIDR